MTSCARSTGCARVVIDALARCGLARLETRVPQLHVDVGSHSLVHLSATSPVPDRRHAAWYPALPEVCRHARFRPSARPCSRDRSKSPNTIASAGQDCTHAGCTSPSASGRPSSFASRFPRWIRCTQNVHFSITPPGRTETSGLSCNSSGSGHSGSNQLKNRTV